MLVYPFIDVWDFAVRTDALGFAMIVLAALVAVGLLVLGVRGLTGRHRQLRRNT